MATFYIQLENRLLQISGELTAENISKALGYVPVSPNVTNELSQRVDNITFNSLKDNPFLQDGSGELNIVDEAGNIIAKVNAEGIHSVDFIAGEHRLSNKTDKAYVDAAIKNVEVDLTGYATEGWVENKNYLTEHQDISHLATKDEIPSIGNLATKDEVSNIEFYNIKDNPIVNNGDGKLLFVDENGYIGLQLEEDGLYVKDVIADGHTLSQKADRAELSNYATKDEVSDLVDMSVVTELQGKVNRLIDADGDKSVRDIAVDVLTETLVSETAADAYDTLEEMSAWIKSHPGDAAAMNLTIQKNATAITNLDTAYKAADAEVLKDAQEYTNNINFYAIKDNPIVDNNDGNLTFVDALGNIGLQFSNNAILVNDVITPEHTLSNKADKAELPTKTSELTNDSGFITINDVPKVDIPTKVSAFENDKGYVTASEIPEIPSLDDYVKSENLPNFDDFVKTEDIPSLEGLATEEYVNSKDAAVQQWVNEKGYTTQEDIANINFYSIKDNPIINNGDGRLVFADENGNIGLQIEADNTLYVKDIIAGDHTLSNKADTSYVNAAVAGIVDGAPETLDTLNELSAALKDNADIVDVLNQSIGNKQDKLISGTTIITINNNPILGSGNLDLATTDLLRSFQPKLVSNENIKTINGESILGSGDITISGGGSSDANVQAVDTGDVLDDVNVEYATTAYVDGLIGDINSVLESIINGDSNTGAEPPTLDT